jgi:hypothetical protein
MNIVDTIKTPRLGDANRPFGKAAMIKQPPKPTDASALEVCDDQVPAHRVSFGNKYESILKTMKLGQCIKCKPDEIGRVAGAMRNYVAAKKINATVRTIKDYGDGKGRVWMLAVEKKLRVAA